MNSITSTNFQNFVYIIKGISTSNKIKYYIGYTDNLYERIRKHNREIVGGAKATRGYKWNYCCIFTNIRSRIEGLQLEKRLQICKRRGNITDKINTFLNYVDTNNRVSPNGQILKNKIFFYINKNLLINVNKLNINPINTLIFTTNFTDIIIDHLMEFVDIKKLSKKNRLRQERNTIKIKI
jgi:predicted GIY-YIG superfamily endonuclease